MAIINFNYQRAMTQANQIETIANQMSNLTDRQFQTTLDSIGVCWRGDASQQFIGYCSQTQTDIRSQAKRLRELAARIRQVAKIIKEAEERAKAAQRAKAAAAAQKS
jgi:uncharacterized protein YukE